MSTDAWFRDQRVQNVGPDSVTAATVAGLCTSGDPAGRLLTTGLWVWSRLLLSTCWAVLWQKPQMPNESPKNCKVLWIKAVHSYNLQYYKPTNQSTPWINWPSLLTRLLLLFLFWGFPSPLCPKLVCCLAESSSDGQGELVSLLYFHHCAAINSYLYRCVAVLRFAESDEGHRLHVLGLLCHRDELPTKEFFPLKQE